MKNKSVWVMSSGHGGLTELQMWGFGYDTQRNLYVLKLQDKGRLLAEMVEVGCDVDMFCVILRQCEYDEQKQVFYCDEDTAVLLLRLLSQFERLKCVRGGG